MMHRLLGISLCALAVSATACVTADAPDQGDDIETSSTASDLTGGPWTWVNAATNLCLDNNASGSVYTQTCNGGSYQKWTNQPGSYGGDTLTNLATGYCLDSNPGGSVYALPCNGGPYQQWIVQKVSTGWRMLNAATARCLDSNPGGGVYTLACNGGTYQSWL